MCTVGVGGGLDVVGGDAVEFGFEKGGDVGRGREWRGEKGVKGIVGLERAFGGYEGFGGRAFGGGRFRVDVCDMEEKEG